MALSLSIIFYCVSLAKMNKSTSTKSYSNNSYDDFSLKHLKPLMKLKTKWIYLFKYFSKKMSVVYFFSGPRATWKNAFTQNIFIFLFLSYWEYNTLNAFLPKMHVGRTAIEQTVSTTDILITLTYLLTFKF